TWFVADMSISVAFGLPFLEHKTTQGFVLFVNPEVDKYFMQERLSVIATEKGIKLADIAQHMAVLNIRGFLPEPQESLKGEELLMTLEGIKAKWEKIGSPPLTMLVIDSYYKILGDLAENSNDDMRYNAKILDKWLKTIGNPALVEVFHYS